MRVDITPTWEDFYARLHRRSGLDLRLYKQEQMQRRILGVVDAKGLRDLGELAARVENDKDEMRWLMDKLAINVSELYRNPEKWTELEKHVLPALLTRSSRLKCWSAGCSYGAEAYTLASVLETSFPGSHSILGTDIDEAALDQARRGEFSAADVRGVPPAVRERHFEPLGEGWRARPGLRKGLSFRKGNLLADRFETNFDLILCRNVVIYFTDAAKEELYRRLFAALRPGGFLFVGSTERIFSARQIGFESPIPFFYQRPLEGHLRWRNAS
ncbi:MAG: CheR family methyltransferase [Fimbriimonas sp.]